eukprot:5560282-Pyramimonas_sp.AAC.1
MNHVVGIDLIFIWEGSKENIPYLNVTDWGTHYSMFQRVPKGKKAPWNVWLAFCRRWLRAFGPPEILVVDEGKEFMGTFADRASEAGCLVSTIDARAPWKNAKTERAG